MDKKINWIAITLILILSWIDTIPTEYDYPPRIKNYLSFSSITQIFIVHLFLGVIGKNHQSGFFFCDVINMIFWRYK